MIDAGSCFFVYFFNIYAILGVTAVTEFPLVYVGFLIVVFLKGELFRVLTTTFLLLNTAYLFIFNCFLLNGGLLVGYEKFVWLGIAISFLLTLGCLIRMRTFGDRRYCWLLMIAELILTYYPTYCFWGLALSV